MFVVGLNVVGEQITGLGYVELEMRFMEVRMGQPSVEKRSVSFGVAQCDVLKVDMASANMNRVCRPVACSRQSEIHLQVFAVDIAFHVEIVEGAPEARVSRSETGYAVAESRHERAQERYVSLVGVESEVEKLPLRHNLSRY